MLRFDDIKILYINFSKKLSKDLKIKFIFFKVLMKILTNGFIIYHYYYNFIVVNT